MSGHVGICVVYLVDEALDFIFYTHLEQIRRCSDGEPIRIYASVERLAPKYLDHLRALDMVEVCNLGPTELRGSDEHAYYLDRLVDIAVADGAAYVATLDVDSFPVSSAWLERSERLMASGSSLVGVLRIENTDRAAPHPSFMMFPASFYETYRPTFALLRDNPRALAFAKAKAQRLDTGAGYALVLYENELRWSGLTRVNVNNDHALMAGVYGELIFHLGGGSRPKVFSIDVTEARKHRPNAKLEELFPEIAARNEQIAARILERMNTNFDGYISYLLGRPE